MVTMTLTQHPVQPWRKAKASTNQGGCVEVGALQEGKIAVRDTKDRTGPVLQFDPGAWGRFTAAVKAGDLS
jgi:Domain of unknown function (DUF397)